MRTAGFHNRTFASIFVAALSLPFLLAIMACHSADESADENSSSGVIVVNSPATGEVRRVLVAEGARVEAGAPIIEIVVQSEASAAAASPAESAEAQAARNLKSTQADIEAIRAEVVRHEAEVERLTPLVAANQASQAQLDGERALYERAQQRLQQAQSAERNAATELLAARQPGKGQASVEAQALREQLQTARASSAGRVRIISVRVGDHVRSGQPLATLRSGEP